MTAIDRIEIYIRSLDFNKFSNYTISFILLIGELNETL